VIVASSPDTPEIDVEVAGLAERVRSERGNLVWIGRFIPLEDLIHLYTGAAVFVCPSVYEPFGLVNLEAMACETAVVASRVGGIPEIVVEGETGYLIDYDPEHLESFTTALAARVDELLSDAALAAQMGKAGRERVLRHFGWPAIAARTVELYDSLL
jgi:starch synthase